MKAKNEEIRLAYLTLDFVLETFEDLKMTTGLKIRKMRRNMKGAVEDLQGEEKKLIEEYCQDEEEKFSFRKGSHGEILGYVARDKSKQSELDEKFKTLTKTEVEIEICPILDPKDFEDHVGSMKFLELLGPFFKDEDE